MNHIRSISYCFPCLLALSAVTMLGMQPPAMQPTEPAPPEDENPEMMSPAMQPTGLAGPIVPESATHTLVHYNARGEFQRLEALPEMAAIDLLNLDPERRQQTWKLIEDYRDSVRDLLVDQIDLLKDATDAQRAGNNQRVQELYRQLYDTFNPRHERDRLSEPLCEILTPEERHDFRHLVDEYWKAWTNWEVRNRPSVTDVQRMETESRLAFGLFQQQIARAYQTSLRPYQQKLESMYGLVSPTDEQRSQLRELIIGFVRTSRLNPTPEQRAELARQIYDLLDESQRVKLTEYALSRL